MAKAMFPVRLPGPGPGFGYDIIKDGRLIMPKPVQPANGMPFTVVVNWPAWLKK